MVAARKLKSVLRIADGAGVRPAAILARVGLTEADLADDERLLGQDKWRDVWHVAVELLDNEAIGLQAGQRVDRGYFGVIDYLVRSSPSVGEALDVAVRFFRLANSHGRLDVIHEDGLVAVERHVLGDEAGALPPQAAEFALASMVQLFRDAAAPAWRLTRATFRHPEPRDSEQHRRFFACPVEFSARADAIVIDESVLSVGMRAPDPELRRLVASHGETLLRALPESGTIVEEVRRVLLRELPGARNGS
ncbi:MAG: AraC family transcriptional regulator, partial [Myxococcota bacterium]